MNRRNPGRTRADGEFWRPPRAVLPVTLDLPLEEIIHRSQQYAHLPNETTALIGRRYTADDDHIPEIVFAIQGAARHTEPCGMCVRHIPADTLRTVLIHPPMRIGDRTYDHHHLQPTCFGKVLPHWLEIDAMPVGDAEAQMVSLGIGSAALRSSASPVPMTNYSN